MDHAAVRPSRPLSFLTDANRERARRLVSEGRAAEAVVAYQVLVDVDPDDVAAALELARLWVGMGRYDRAADEHLRLAGVYAGQSDQRQAMRAALQALRLDPSRVVRERLAPLVARLGTAAADLCEQISRVHVLAGRPEQARDVLRLLVEADPGQLARRLTVAELDLAQGRTAEALAELRIVADGLRTHGRTEELVRVLEMMHAHGGPDEAVLRELATIYVRWGQPRRALAKLEVLCRVAPRDRVALERLARVHASLGRVELCVRLLERLVGLIDEQADRGELRAMLRRAASWCSELGYHRALEDLGLRALRLGGLQLPAPRAARAGGRRRGSSPPPLPRWSGAAARASATSGEIHVLDGLEAELVLELDEVATLMAE